MSALHSTLAPPSISRFESRLPKSPALRLDAWDAARLVATFGIVWTHVCDAHGLGPSVGTLGRYGTSYYILAAALFTVRSHLRPATRKYSEEFKSKTRRLLLPFLVWSAVYFIYYYVDSLHTGESFLSLSRWWGPVAGTALHLWFLPFIYFWGLWGAWAVPKLMKLNLTWLTLGGLLSSAFVYWVCYRKIFFWVDRQWLWTWHLHRLDRWIDEVPLYFSAIVLGTAFQRLSPRAKSGFTRFKVQIALASLAVFLIVQFLYSQNVHYIREHTGTDGRFMANLAGLAILCGSASMGHTRVIAWLAPWGRFTYVAFLVHVLVLEMTRNLLKELPGYGGLMTAALSTCFIFFVSLGVSMLISKLRFFKFLRP